MWQWRHRTCEDTHEASETDDVDSGGRQRLMERIIKLGTTRKLLVLNHLRGRGGGVSGARRGRGGGVSGARRGRGGGVSGARRGSGGEVSGARRGRGGGVSGARRGRGGGVSGARRGRGGGESGARKVRVRERGRWGKWGRGR